MQETQETLCRSPLLSQLCHGHLGLVWEQCGAGGDAFISICLWQAGFAVTDPGYSFYHPEIQMMDPGPEDRLGIMMKLARALDANRCDERCRVSIPLHTNACA